MEAAMRNLNSWILTFH